MKSFFGRSNAPTGKPKMIMVLCTSGNVVTPGHVAVLDEAVELHKHKYDIKPIIMPVNDNYINYSKAKRPDHINMAMPDSNDPAQIKSNHRICYDGESRMRIAEAAAKNSKNNIQVSDYEITNTALKHPLMLRGKETLPQTRGAHPYIEHYQTIAEMQAEEFANAKKEGREPAMVVLVAGTDLVVHPSVGNVSWQSETSGCWLPYVACKSRDVMKAEHDPANKTNADAHAERKKYLDQFPKGILPKKLPNHFTEFKNTSYELPKEEYREVAKISSSKLAACNIEVIKLCSKDYLDTVMQETLKVATSELPVKPADMESDEGKFYTSKASQKNTARDTIMLLNHYNKNDQEFRQKFDGINFEGYAAQLGGKGKRITAQDMSASELQAAGAVHNMSASELRAAATAPAPGATSAQNMSASELRAAGAVQNMSASELRAAATAPAPGATSAQNMSASELQAAGAVHNMSASELRAAAAPAPTASRSAVTGGARPSALNALPKTSTRTDKAAQAANDQQPDSPRRLGPGNK